MPWRSAPEVEAPTVVSAGFPCPPFSGAARSLGIEDARGLEVLQVLECGVHCAAPLIVAENVGNLMRHQNGLTWLFMQQLAAAAGYVLRVQRVDNASVWLPLHRERLTIIWIHHSMPTPAPDTMLLAQVPPLPCRALFTGRGGASSCSTSTVPPSA